MAKMKPSELVDEGLGNWLARKGLFGTSAGIAATGAHLSKQQAAAQDAAMGMQKEKFKKDLANALAQAVQSGLVTGVIPESIEYKEFNRLLENRILNEAMSVNDFMLQYVGNLTANLKLSSAQNTALQQIITDFSSNYRGPRSPLPQEADKLWSILQSLKSLQGKQQSKLKDYGAPAPNTKVDVNGHIYTYDGAEWKDSTGNPVEVEDDIKALNKKAYEERFAGQPPGRDIPYTSSMHGTQYKWSYDKAADEWSGYPRNEPNPPVTSPVIVGNTDTRYAMLNKAYHSQSGI